ncbi:major facilitator superfamily MFS_1 [Emticicia oligotrophica DSM 17448]|uniref:Major facilitator superfamily MFS_1 n=1 Tax=Emticicia oligotrophica (strain DSM 17448 / CIP 109782 / MTCC 6937 / GPTSA100-15) TaxID=929562 RepID=A0ABM5N555_EMTOG|nr:MFS transporter [Emticicia oligotrophica]AFK04498.1 major facilitator superfamily MFS_1 [Emticicia oligotrophica DSM 17448]
MKIRHRVLFLLFLLSIITFLDRVCMNVVSKYVKADLSLDNQSFGYILGAFSLAYALFELPTGVLGDRIGPRRILTRVVLWWSGFTALTGTAFGFAYLLIVRFLFGMGEAGAYPNASIVISKWFPAIEVGRAQSVIWAAGRIGGALTPLLVIPLVHAVGWRSAFFVLGVVGCVWAGIWYYWFRDTPSEHPAISKDEIEEIESSRRQIANNHKISWQTIVRNPNIWILMLMCHLFFYASYFFTNWSSTYFQEGRHMTEDQAKNFVSLSYFLGAIGCVLGGFASDFLTKKYGLKIGRRVVGVAGLGTSSICFLGAGLTTDNELAGYLLALCVLLKDLTLPVAFAVCVDIGKRNSGTVTGAMNFAGQMGGFFITIIFGTIVQQTGNFNYPLFLIAACLIVSSALWFFIDPTKEIIATD